MSQDKKPNTAPEQQAPKSARATEAPAVKPMHENRETAQPRPQRAENENRPRNERAEVEATPERTPERRTPERADDTGKQRSKQQAPR
jgi:hypothetical protein